MARHLARLGVQAGHKVVSVIRNENHSADLSALGAKPLILSLEDAPVPDLVAALTKAKPDVVVFAAGAGGKGDKSRTRKVDYEGAVKVYDAMESANCKKLILVGAVDIRDRESDVPGWYNDEDVKASDRMWNAIPAYCQAKYDAEVELHKRKQIAYTVIRPGTLTSEPAANKGVKMGRTHIGKTSRELVARTILAVATTPGTDGLSIDVMDDQGDGTVEGELEKVIEQSLDSWIG